MANIRRSSQQSSGGKMYVVKLVYLAYNIRLLELNCKFSLSLSVCLSLCLCLSVCLSLSLSFRICFTHFIMYVCLYLSVPSGGCVLQCMHPYRVCLYTLLGNLAYHIE